MTILEIVPFTSGALHWNMGIHYKKKTLYNYIYIYFFWQGDSKEVDLIE